MDIDRAMNPLQKCEYRYLHNYYYYFNKNIKFLVVTRFLNTTINSKLIEISNST